MVTSTFTNEIVKASTEVIGRDVKNRQDENLGKIEELAVDKISGKIQYAVLSFGGILGIGDKLFALPWNKLNYDPEDECFRIEISKDRLKNAPGFDKNHWPNFAEPSYLKTITDYYKETVV